MGKNIEKRNILFKNRMCSPIIEARSTKRGCESIVKYCFFIVLVLIDTWWNVNEERRWGMAAGMSFNRYMVECECLSLSISRTLKPVLIDTWWNVNTPLDTASTAKSIVLIDTWWNVNV